METRDQFLNTFRGETIGSVTLETSEEELFQNTTLRPILKLQNELLISIFINYCVKQKSVFFSLSSEKKLGYIENVFQNDVKFRNTLKGVVIGLFTLEEFEEYLKKSSSINKRMMNLLIERFKSQIQLIID